MLDPPSPWSPSPPRPSPCFRDGAPSSEAMECEPCARPVSGRAPICTPSSTRRRTDSSPLRSGERPMTPSADWGGGRFRSRRSVRESAQWSGRARRRQTGRVLPHPGRGATWRLVSWAGCSAGPLVGRWPCTKLGVERARADPVGSSSGIGTTFGRYTNPRSRAPCEGCWGPERAFGPHRGPRLRAAADRGRRLRSYSHDRFAPRRDRAAPARRRAAGCAGAADRYSSTLDRRRGYPASTRRKRGGDGS